METITVAAAIIAVTQAMKMQFPQISGLLTMLVAIILGALAGYFHLEGLTIQAGIIAALTAIGTVTTAQKISA